MFSLTNREVGSLAQPPHPLQDFYWSYQLRAKMVVRTEEVVAVGHHRIHDWVNPTKSYNTPIPQQVPTLFPSFEKCL